MTTNCFVDFMDPKPSFDPTKAPTSQTQNNLTDTIVKELFESAQSLFPARIYRVPKDLHELNKSAYIPRIISIGPLHCKEAHLQTPMQDVKKHYANYLFSRVTENNDNQKDKKKTELLLKCVEKMKQCVDRAKKYYAEELKLNDDDMVKMMLVDGCFILELLYAYHTNKSKAAEEKTTNGRNSGNPKVRIAGPEASSSVQKTIDGGEDGSKSSSVGELPWNSKMIKQDLIFLENQIPFFVLEDLFKLIVDEIPDPEENKLSLTEYVLEYFDNIWRPRRKLVESRSSKTKTSCCLPDECVLCIFDSTKENEKGEEESRKANDENGEEESMKANDYYHILHFLHEHYCPSKTQNPPQEKNGEVEVSASELHYAGVKFISVQGNIDLFDVNFREPKFLFWWFFSARFEIPTLDIDGPTEPLLRNLIALEQCCPAVDQYYTSYAKFMDILISSEEDVKVLKKAKVIRNHLGKDKDVCCLFNNLCKDVVIGEFYFEDQCREAYKYSQHGWPKWRAYWKRTYVESPWGIVAFSVAIIVFGVTVSNFVRWYLK